MPEHYRALIYILIMASLAFAYARKLVPGFIDKQDFVKRRNAWLVLTVAAFILGNFWVYSVILFLYLSTIIRKDRNPVALYFFLLLMLPTGNAIVPGFGMINYLIGISHQKLLVLVILVPAMLRLADKKIGFRFGSTLPDKIIITYFLYLLLIYFRDTEFTNAIRYGVTNLLVMILPYYVISRYLRTLAEFRDALMSLLVAIIVTASIALMEYFKHWLLYAPISGVMDLSTESSYLARAGMLRAMGTTGHSIALGYTMTIGMGLYLYCGHFAEKKFAQRSGWGALGIGHMAALSRGPWIGAILLVSSFLATGKRAAKKLTLFFTALVVAMGILAVLPGGHKIIDLLPYIGTVDAGNITFREKLYNNSMKVIARNPWTGTTNYLDEPEIQEMYNGFVIDIVNTYLGLALASGIIGVGLFGLFFFVLCFQILKALRRIPDKSSESHVLGRALLGTLLAILLVLVTTSPVGIIPTMYWAMAGVAAAYVRMIKESSLKPSQPDF